MNKQLKSILDELYQLDPELKHHEQELVPIIQKLLATKPDAIPDEAFVQNLRMMLREKAHATGNSQPATRNFFSFLAMPTFHYAVTGAILGAVITGPIVYSVVNNGGAFPTDTSTPIFSYSVEETGQEAFGDLSQVATAEAYGRGGGGDAATAPAHLVRPQSGGGGGGDVGMSADMKLIAPEMTNYNVIFDGEMPALTNEQVEILQRQRGVSNADINKILGSFNTGLIDLDSFNGAKVESLSFYQDTQYGYSTYVNFRDGSININANWEKWPQPQANCTTEECFQRYMPKIDDIPADDVLINIANAFVKDHNIELAQYGTPAVDKSWRASYDAATDKSMVYVPDTIRVTYPFMVDGKPVLDESGMNYGISIGVNIREKKVADAWNITDQKYLKSAYPAITDTSVITSYLEKFGKMDASWMPEGTNMKIVDITLGTPEIGYVKMYQYSNNENKELIVPALVFPVTNVPAGEYFYRNAVTVPLAKELFDSVNSVPDPRPMPIEPIIMEDSVRTDTPQE